MHSSGYYDGTCQNVQSTIGDAVRTAVAKERGIAPALLRLHSYDCFINGCDGSILLDSEEGLSELYSTASANLRGFELIDDIKKKLDSQCGAPVVSCADILAVAARDAVVALEGPWWEVQLGRLDGTNSSLEAPFTWISFPFDTVEEAVAGPKSLKKMFEDVGLDLTDLVALSGAHTIGSVPCGACGDRYIGDKPLHPIDTDMLGYMRKQCKDPATRIPIRMGKHPNIGLKAHNRTFSNGYYDRLVDKMASMSSDQALLTSNLTRDIVIRYANSETKFFHQFSASMIKMAGIKPETTGHQVYGNNTIYGIREGSCTNPKSIVKPKVQATEDVTANLLGGLLGSGLVNGVGSTLGNRLGSQQRRAYRGGRRFLA